jgi:hypothetical protein
LLRSKPDSGPVDGNRLVGEIEVVVLLQMRRVGGREALGTIYSLR